jgi:surface antigen
LSFLFKDGQERSCDSLSLIDAVVPEIVENRRKELQQQQQQQQQQQLSTSSSGKNEAKLSSRPTTTTATNLPNTNDKDISSIHQPTNTSPQSTHQTISDRSNMDTSSIPTTPNGGSNYGNL